MLSVWCVSPWHNVVIQLSRCMVYPLSPEPSLLLVLTIPLHSPSHARTHAHICEHIYHTYSHTNTNIDTCTCIHTYTNKNRRIVHKIHITCACIHIRVLMACTIRRVCACLMCMCVRMHTARAYTCARFIDRSI